MTFKTLALCILMLLAAGCTNSVNTVSRAEPMAQPNVVNDKRVITDTSLGNKLAINRVVQATVSGDLLKVQVDVTNLSKDRLSFNYRFEWYDVDGMLIQTTSSPWKRKMLLGGESTSPSTVATSPRAVDFTLELAPPKS